MSRNTYGFVATPVTRRGLVVGAALAAAGAHLATTDLASAQQDALAASARIYQGHAPGFMGDLTVDVAVDGEKILGIWAVENTERFWKQPSESAVEVLSRRVVEEQSLAVDGVTGATFSSRAFLTAAQSALEDAGVDASPFMKEVAHERAAGKDVECDVLVVGSGWAGMIAALSVATNDLAYEKSGLSVIMVEREHFPGGSSAASGGGMISFCGSRANAKVGADADPDALAAKLEEYCTVELNHPLIASMLSVSGDTCDKLFDLGSPFSVARAGKFQWGDDGPAGAMLRAKEYTTVDRCATGIEATSHMYTCIREMGVDVRLGTDAYELLTEGAAVCGAKVRTYDEEYAIRAKKVILATGGCARDSDMLATYAPEYEGSVVFCNGGDNGDGQKMMLELGATMRGYGAIAYPGTLTNGILGKTSQATHYAKGIYLDRDGNRFNDGRFMYPGPYGSAAFAKYINACEDHFCWNVFDSSMSYAPLFETGMDTESNGGVKADSIEELAEKTGMPLENLQASLADVEAAVATGQDAEFHVPVELFGTMTQPPFFAVEMHSCVIGTECGIDVDADCRVLGEGGEPIDNLFTCGESMFGNFECDFYVAGGGSLANCMMSGRLAGEAAKAEIVG